MCMNCGCGEPEKRHHPTDITSDDLQRAADGGGIGLHEAARNLQESSQALAGDGMTSGKSAGSGNWPPAERA
jgi:hypothetical protein